MSTCAALGNDPFHARDEPATSALISEDRKAFGLADKPLAWSYDGSELTLIVGETQFAVRLMRSAHIPLEVMRSLFRCCRRGGGSGSGINNRPFTARYSHPPLPSVQVPDVLPLIWVCVCVRLRVPETVVRAVS